MLALALLMLVANLLVAAERGARETDWGAARLYFTALLAGALMGALGLTRYALGVLILPVMLYFNFFFAPRSLSLGFAALLGFAAVMAPWLMRNHEVSGRLFGVASLAVHQATDRFPGDRIERLLDPENKFTHEDLRQVSLDEHWGKLGDNLPGILQNDLPRIGGSWVAAFFLAGLLVAGFAVSVPVFLHAQAQQYPSRPIRLISPYPPGGSVENMIRMVSERVARKPILASVSRPPVRVRPPRQRRPGTAPRINIVFSCASTECTNKF